MNSKTGLTLFKAMRSWSASGLKSLVQQFADRQVPPQIFNGVKNRSFSTTVTTMATEKEKEECAKKKVLPCLKPSHLAHDIAAAAKANKAKGSCDRVCLPCCAPARDPPTCYHPYIKAPCQKQKPPRPAYSECKRDHVKSVPPCECNPMPIPRCDISADEAKAKGCGK